MRMKLTILGSGTMLPTKERFPSAFLLEESATKILLDCGHGALARLTEIGVDPREIDAIFISHFHTDHIGDAFNLVHARFVGDLYEGKEHRLLTFFGPTTLQERFRKWREISWPEPGEEQPLEFYEGTFELKIGDIHIRTFPIIHVPWFPSVGARITVSGKTIVYPGDVGSAQDFNELVEVSKNADLLIIESGGEKPTPNHFTLEQTEELARRANISKVLIVHLRPTVSEKKRVQKFAEDKPNYTVAEDKTVIAI